MSFLENLEESMFPEEAGNGEVIQDEIPFKLEERLSIDQIERYNQKIKDSQDYAI
jgi:hypothetical protein